MSTKNAKISVEELESLRFKMIAMPVKQKTELNIREAVKSLETEIRSMLTDGYTMVDIARMFKEVDAEVTASTIAAYLRDMTAGRVTKKKAAKAGMQKAVAERNAVKTVPALTEAEDSTVAAEHDLEPRNPILDAEALVPEFTSTVIGDAEEEAPLIRKIDELAKLAETEDESTNFPGFTPNPVAGPDRSTVSFEEDPNLHSADWELEPE